MDRRLLLGVGMSAPDHGRPKERRVNEYPAVSARRRFGAPASGVCALMLAALCGCGGSAREADFLVREGTQEKTADTPYESAPETAPEAQTAGEQPDAGRGERGGASEPPLDVPRGARFEHRLPDMAAAEQTPLSDEPEGPRAAEAAPEPVPKSIAKPVPDLVPDSVPKSFPQSVPAPAPTIEKSWEDNPRYAEPPVVAELKPAPVEPPTRAAPSPADKGFSRVRIFYATDRQRGGDAPNEFYGDQRRLDESGAALDLGYCEVSVPYGHTPGEVERPSVWKLEFRENPMKHVVLLNVQPVEHSRWQADVRASVSESEDRSALVFVHGFNVDFASAARRTAQMKYDLGFPGAAILYSWPAPANYVECEGNAMWTLPHLMEFLTRYVQQSGAAKIHLVAHSMGTRVLTTALKELAASPAAAPVRYDEIILAAPDIDAAIFKQQIAPRIVNAAERISIYSSSQDWALVASKKAHRYKRLGEGGENVTTFPEWPQIEVLDASNVDESLLGHSYYGNSPTILRDVRGVLAGIGAAARGLRAQASYYVFNAKRTQLSQRPR